MPCIRYRPRAPDHPPDCLQGATAALASENLRRCYKQHKTWTKNAAPCFQWEWAKCKTQNENRKGKEKKKVEYSRIGLHMHRTSGAYLCADNSVPDSSERAPESVIHRLPWSDENESLHVVYLIYKKVAGKRAKAFRSIHTATAPFPVRPPARAGHNAKTYVRRSGRRATKRRTKKNNNNKNQKQYTIRALRIGTIHWNR